jgi:hypothetical protein
MLVGKAAAAPAQSDFKRSMSLRCLEYRRVVSNQKNEDGLTSPEKRCSSIH